MANPLSSPLEPESPQRDDLVPTAYEGIWQVLCVRCRRIRMVGPRDKLPAPGECDACRKRDPKRYWTRDWEKRDG